MNSAIPSELEKRMSVEPKAHLAQGGSLILALRLK